MCHQYSVTFDTVDTCAIIFDTQHIEPKGIIRTVPSLFQDDRIIHNKRFK